MTGEQKPEYKFEEDINIEDILNYINSTYTGHYAKGKVQTTEVIIDDGHGLSFCLGNALKYLRRYGLKDGYNKKDLYKAIHYLIISVYLHNKEKKEDKNDIIK